MTSLVMMELVAGGLYAVSATGLSYMMLNAFQSGAEAYSETYSASAARGFEDVFLFIPPRRIAEIAWACAGLSFILLLVVVGRVSLWLGLAVAVIGSLAAFHIPELVLTIVRQRRLRKFEGQLVDTLINMSNSLKAGFSITQAFESVVKEGEIPIAQEFDVVLQQTRVGVTFSDALMKLDARVGSKDLMLVVMAIETARRTGGNLTEVFEKIAATIRERLRVETRIQTLTAQGRLQGHLLSAMPLVIGGLLALVDPGMMRPFVESRAGLGVMLLVAGFVVVGGVMIRRIVKIDV